ncbi:hypothetical protein OpiT1DRAFT_02996 [Opitutaceae bacterium TAV1]|nr:hypothetical protein OpiT1DRAFT_02996 [Opitutaceae bacterium TAV1]
MKTATSVQKLCLLGLLSAFPLQGWAATLFEENFNSAGDNTLVTTLPGWSAYISKKAFRPTGSYQYNYNNDASAPAYGVTQVRLIGNHASNPVAGAVGGFLNVNTTNSEGALGTPIIAVVRTGLDIALSGYDDLTISWKGAGTTASGAWVADPLTTNILIQVGDQWYVSAAEYTLSGGGWTSGLDANPFSSLTISTDQNAWKLFTLVPSTTTDLWAAANGEMSVGGTAAADLSGTITGIGLLTTFPSFESNGIATAAAYDQLSITGTPIPEPAALAALAGLAGLTVVLARRRR